MKTARDVCSSPSSPAAEPAATETAQGRAPRLECRPAASAADLAAHYAVRRQVFVREQGIFPVDDGDGHDDAPDVIHVVGLVDGRVRGAVRLYPLDRAAGLWKGDRLAVLDNHRHHGLGAPLVRFAVRVAGQCGGREMVAYIQPDNARFFEHLGWRRVGGLEDYVGVPHQRMVIALAAANVSGGPSPTRR
ncbi:MAG: MSMEG_0567/Sll0786 family nitrogen starvation N-acetyltransferase [Streptosporangiaceae bacterium]